jgi:hypothetical protein
MRLKGYVNLRDNFESTLHEIANVDIFVSEALYTKCLVHKQHDVSDARVYDLLFMMRFAGVPPQGELRPFSVQLGRPVMKVVTYIHPRVRALCVALPDEESLWSPITNKSE